MLKVLTGGQTPEGMYLLDVKPMRGIPNCVCEVRQKTAHAWAPALW
jgi:hypothetical protein